MGRKNYPQINLAKPLAEPHNHKCGARGCGKQAKGYVRVEFSYMRGEDEIVYSCSEHAKGCYSNPSAFCKRFPPEAWHE